MASNVEFVQAECQTLVTLGGVGVPQLEQVARVDELAARRRALVREYDRELRGGHPTRIACPLLRELSHQVAAGAICADDAISAGMTPLDAQQSPLPVT